MSNEPEEIIPVIQNFKGYNGNKNLKRQGVVIEWTPYMLEEYAKCAADPIYFATNYMKIVHVDRGLIPFTMYGYQEDMVRSYNNNRYSIVLTARQSGKTTSATAFLLWYILFNEDKTVALLANKGDTAREILGRIQLAYEHLPKWLQQGVKEWNKGSFELENNSRIIASASNGDAIRGYSISLLFLDECAFIENFEEFFSSVFPTISSGASTKIIMVSTPNGLNHFYKFWEDAVHQRNDYNPIKVMWSDVPGRDEKWKESTLRAMSNNLEKFSQEHCCEFQGSSGTLISGWKLKELVHQGTLFDDGGLKIYENPIPDHAYAIVADVSRGKGLDHSAFSVIDITSMPYKQVCVYRNNLVLPREYAEIMFGTAKQYNKAVVLIEINDLGQQVADILYNDLEYDGVIFTENAGRAGKRITFSGKTSDIGIRTTKLTKATGCAILKILIESNQLIINDFDTIAELSRFSRKANSYMAENGFHDDLVMGLVIFGWLSDQQFFKELTNINTLSSLRDTEESQLIEMLPVGFLQTGHNDDVDEFLGEVVMTLDWR